MNSKVASASINTFSGGMNHDLDVSIFKSNAYSFAENIRVSANVDGTFGSISPIEDWTTVLQNQFNGESIVHSETIRDVSVVFTRKNGTTSIYRISGQSQLSITKIASFTYSIPDKISVVSRYEDIDNINIYWADGIGQIKSINISSKFDSINITRVDANDFNIIPPSINEKPIIDSIGTGKLYAGRYQYAYQFITESGKCSSLSVLSNPVDVLKSEYIGGKIEDTYGEASGKSVKVKISKPTNDIYTRIRLISIYYYSSAATPQIKTVYNSSIIKSQDDFIYLIDNGTSIVDELTLDEFVQLASNHFSASTIESKDNILFAANTKELEFDVEYDARSFRFKPISEQDRSAVLYAKDLTTFISVNPNELQTINIDKDFDCINKEIYEEYRYSDLEYTKDIQGNEGGSGNNVDFKFVNTFLTGSRNGNRWAYPRTGEPIGPEYPGIGEKYIDDRIVRLGSDIKDVESFTIQKSDGTIVDIPLSDIGMSNYNGRSDYSNSFVSGALQGYKRDEIYRFAVVMYSEDGRKSSAKWIADIRFPAGYYQDNNWESNVFEMPEKLGRQRYDNISNIKTSIVINGFEREKIDELIVRPLGIEFTFRNIPPSVSKIEIVRAKRDINNRTIYCQSIVGKVGKYSAADHKQMTTRDNIKFYDTANAGTLRPHPILGMGYNVAIAPIGYDNNGVFNQQANIGYLGATMTGRAISYECYADTQVWKSQTENLGSSNHMLDTRSNTSLITQSPYFSSINTFKFISPEFSYYGDDYVEGLRDSSSNLKAVFSSIVMPKLTPATVSMSTSTADEASSVYFGNSAHSKLRFYYDGKAYPTAMYSMADLTEDIYSLESSGGVVKSDGTLFSLGLAGIHPYQQIGGDMSYNNDDMYSGGSWDVQPIAYESNIQNKVYISGYGVISRVYNSAVWVHKVALSSHDGRTDSKNTSYDAVAQDNTAEPLMYSARNKYLKAGLGSASYKYFNYFRKNVGGYNTYFDYATLLYQNGQDSTDYSTKRIYNIGEIDPVQISDFSYSGDIVNPTNHQSISEFRYIGGNSYSNFAKTLTKIIRGNGAGDVDDVDRFEGTFSRGQFSGPHGSCLIVSTGNSTIPSIAKMVSNDGVMSYSSEFNTAHSLAYNSISVALATYLVDLKEMSFSIYGGPSIDDRQFTEYISTGAFSDVNARESQSIVFGGDTFISMFDYTMIHALDQTKSGEYMMNEYNNWWNDVILSQTNRIGAIIPIETSINTFSDSGSTYNKTNNILVQKEPGFYSPGASHGTKFTAAQDNSEFDYNSAYSSDRTAYPYLSSLLDSELDKKYDCRIIYSDPKTNDEKIDSWTSFRAANYIDVDTRYGEITRLKNHLDKLYFFQENSLGVLSVNDRSLITDESGASLSLGTGGVLNRYDYMSNSTGISKNTINGLLSSESGMYWFDKDRNSIYRVSDSIEQLSKTKGIQSMLNYNKDSILNNVLIWENKKHNEILFSLGGLTDKYRIKND